MTVTIEEVEFERWCDDCWLSWWPKYEADGNTIADQTDRVCPHCGSDNVVPLSEARRRPTDEDLRDAAADAAYDLEVDERGGF